MTDNGRVLIFDLDGTLLDTMGPFADMFCGLMLERRGIPEAISRPIYIREMGKGPRPQVVEVLRATESLDDALVDALTTEYWLMCEAHPPALFPETIDVLDALARQGHELVVSSGGKPDFVERNTRLTGIERWFRLLLGTDPLVPGLAKGPGHFALIRESLGLRDGELRERGVFIGDGVFDMQVARAAGVLAVGRLTRDNGDVLTAAGAQHLISDLTALAAILDAP